MNLGVLVMADLKKAKNFYWFSGVVDVSLTLSLTPLKSLKVKSSLNDESPFG